MASGSWVEIRSNRATLGAPCSQRWRQTSQDKAPQGSSLGWRSICLSALAIQLPDPESSPAPAPVGSQCPEARPRKWGPWGWVVLAPVGPCLGSRALSTKEIPGVPPPPSPLPQRCICRGHLSLPWALQGPALLFLGMGGSCPRLLFSRLGFTRLWEGLLICFNKTNLLLVIFKGHGSWSAAKGGMGCPGGPSRGSTDPPTPSHSPHPALGRPPHSCLGLHLRPFPSVLWGRHTTASPQKDEKTPPARLR